MKQHKSKSEIYNKANDILNFLASMPQGNTTVRKEILREILEITDGTMLSRGSLYYIQCKYLGVGIYSIFLRKSPSSK